jgi:hypothetical protein
MRVPCHNRQQAQQREIAAMEIKSSNEIGNHRPADRQVYYKGRRRWRWRKRVP